MSRRRSPECLSLLEDIHRFAWKELPVERAKAVEDHLTQCEACRETVAFIREFGNEVGGKLFDSEEVKEPCPTTVLLANVEADLADEDEAHHVRAHLVHCLDCSKRFLMLRGLRNREETVADLEERSEAVPGKSFWGKYYERARRALIDIGRQFEPGTQIGAIRVTGLLPALALRGESSSTPTRFMFEVSVGNNVYGCDLSLREGQLNLDIAGYKWIDKLAATVTLYRDAGLVLGSTKTDAYGNARLSLRYEWHPQEKLILVVVMNDDVWESVLLVLGL